MLNSIDLSDKTYEDILSDAIARIPLYSSEWTNFNVSDPGITVLQNFSAFSLLQQSYINTVNDEIRLRLLGLLGYKPQHGRAAHALLMPEERRAAVLPSHHKLYVGETCFETERETALSTWRLAAAYSVQDGAARDVTYQLDRTLPATAAVFGEQPTAGSALVCVLEGEIESGETLRFYVELQDEKRRNPFADDRLLFAQARWQYYTAKGWRDCAAMDETRAFLCSGEVCMTLGDAAPVVLEDYPVKGPAIRCLLSRADYDIAPRVRALSENLFPVVQRDTRAACFRFAGTGPMRIYSDMTGYENIFVYCRERAGGDYFAYRRYTGQIEPGRYFLLDEAADGAFVLSFDRAQFGYGPDAGADAVRAVCYAGETIHHRVLGMAFGYEDQELDIELLENVLPDSFCLIAETVGRDGRSTFRFIEPGEHEGEDLCYEVLSAPGKIRITRMDAPEVSKLYLANCAVTSGAGGNIRAGSRLMPPSDPYGYLPQELPVYLSPGPGRGGTTEEDAEQLRRRFVREMKRVTSAVTAHDYEELARRTPGLCIHKVRAVAVPEDNLVRLTVKPCSDSRFPKLSETYRRQIEQYLEPRRMITTRFELCQPRYVAIDVRAKLYVKTYYKNVREEIEALIARELDYVSGPQGFGETVSFTALYRKLEELPGVEGVYALALEPVSREDAVMSGADVRLGESCLCYLGRLTLETTTFQSR